MKALLLFFFPFVLWAAELDSVKTIVDQDGDKILILDADAQYKIQSANQIKATNVYDDEGSIENFKKDYQEKVLTDDKQYGEYVVAVGDTLVFISQQIYGTPSRWKDLQLANEKLLENSVLRPGLILKYPIDKKEKDNGRKTRRTKKK